MNPLISEHSPITAVNTLQEDFVGKIQGSVSKDKWGYIRSKKPPKTPHVQTDIALNQFVLFN